MRPYRFLLASLITWPLFSTCWAAHTEQELIQVLQSGASLTEKDAACAQLKRIGTQQCIPALAALLTDAQLSHSARYALEPMNVEAAGEALLQALPKTDGLIQAGIIQSLGIRAEPRAVSALVPLLSKLDNTIAVAAARALAQIGGAEATKALNAASKNPEPLHSASVDGLLRCANQLLLAGNASEAQALFQALYVLEQAANVRVAAYRGLIRCSDERGLDLMVAAIAGQPGPAQTAALQLVRELQAPGATDAITKLLAKVSPPVQISLIEGLHQRGDASAVPALLDFTKAASPAVRPALALALSALGDATVVPILIQFAASRTAAEQAAARQALTDLSKGDVTGALLDQLATADAAAGAEIARALGERGANSAVPRLLQLVRQGTPQVRKATLSALAQLADQTQLNSLVELVLQANEDSSRNEAAEALNSACQRLMVKDRKLDVDPLVKGLESGSSASRLALFPVCSGLTNEHVRAELRRSVQESDPKIRDGAIRAMSDSVDPQLLDDLVGIARQTKDQTLQTLAINGAVRLATQEDHNDLVRPRRVAVLRDLLSIAARPEEKRIVLAGLGELPEPDALKAVASTLAEPAVMPEASRAAIKIALGLPTTEARGSVDTLRKFLAANPDDATRQGLQQAIKQIEESVEFITAWQVAGPFQQAGKDYSALFDIAFPPEAANSQGAEWRILTGASDPRQPWLIDLLKTLGGEERVAYARTWVHCDQDLAARLELGSDDGIKVWLNNQPVYSRNIARAVQPGSDTCKVNLHSGRNLLMLKITQHNQGWAFCARFRSLDGSHLEGLRFDAHSQSDTR
jgi:HEAT repeat protein